MEYLVQQGASLEDATSWRPGTLAAGSRPFTITAPLHARGGSVEVVQYLVQQGASLEATDNDGWTPLHAAARGGSLAVVEYLVQQGASLEATASFGGTPLHARPGAALWK